MHRIRTVIRNDLYLSVLKEHSPKEQRCVKFYSTEALLYRLTAFEIPGRLNFTSQSEFSFSVPASRSALRQSTLVDALGRRIGGYIFHAMSN